VAARWWPVRLVHVTIPAGKRESVLAALEEEGVDYVVSDETGGRDYTAVATFPLPTAAVEPVLESLRDAGLDEDTFTVVLSAETVESRRFEQMQEAYAEERDEERIAREELRARASELSPETSNFVVLTVISALIATAGVLLDSPATVVGSMVIAPLIGPAMATGVGTVLDDTEMFRRGLRLQVLGVGAGILAATLFAAVIRFSGLVPPGLDLLAVGEIAERAAPGALTLVVAVGAGVAGAMSLRTGVSASLVGVMIAVALVPPLAVVGVGIAWARPVLVIGAGVLVAVNALCINLAALVVFWRSGYRPDAWFREDEARSAVLSRLAVLGAAVLVLSAFLGGVTYVSYQAAGTEQAITEDVESVVATHGSLTLLEVQVERGENPVLPRPERVVVTVGTPTGSEFPQLADEIATALADHDVTIQVRFVAIQQSD
jgi:uncharacterized hydrophobic protein (TIGR00341 family)